MDVNLCNNLSPSSDLRVKSSFVDDQSDVAADDYHKILALDLDETLIHTLYSADDYYDFKVDCVIGESAYPLYVRKRPGVDAFLQAALEYFNVYIYTSSVIEYASSIMQKLIPGFPDSKILHRDHCRYFNGNFIKQLNLFGRDLSQVVIVDDKCVSYCLSPNNGIAIPTWVGDQTDDKLLNTTWPLLEQCSFAKDVRSVIRQFYHPRKRRSLL